ncbi:MAG: hypothetical protein IPI12_01130 [Ignavibacteriales bacterium]|nr:hypothetical protein [Ignavibacteriales bacterium]
MEKKNRIYEYLDGRQGKAASDNFELELKQDDILYKDYLKVKESLGTLKSISEIEPDTDYFVNVLPRFREKVATKQNRAVFPLFAKYASGLILATAAVVLFMVQPWQNTTIESTTQKTAPSELVTSIESQKPVVDDILKAEVKPVAQTRYVYTAPTSAPFMENTEKEAVIINSGTGVVDDEVLATHTDFEGVYSSLFELNGATLVEIADKYGITLVDLVQNLSEEDFEKFSKQLNPTDN